MSIDLIYLSLGAGVQSTALYLLACNGEIAPKPDVAIFADTQQEPYWVYENLQRLKDIGNIPVETVSAGDLGESIEKATQQVGIFVNIPFWVMGQNDTSAPGRRQCTREYKIEPIRQRVRSLLGLAKGERASGRFQVEEWLGISIDEIQRAKASKDKWVHTRWPLIEKRWKRHDCLNYLDSISYPLPRKSSCVFCPYRTEREWIDWKHSHPDLFVVACEWDSKLRDSGPSRGMSQFQYISRSLLPLADAVSMTEIEIYREPELFDGLVDECDGMCGT